MGVGAEAVGELHADALEAGGQPLRHHRRRVLQQRQQARLHPGGTVHFESSDVGAQSTAVVERKFKRSSLIRIEKF